MTCERIMTKWCAIPGNFPYRLTLCPFIFFRGGGGVFYYVVIAILFNFVSLLSFLFFRKYSLFNPPWLLIHFHTFSLVHANLLWWLRAYTLRCLCMCACVWVCLSHKRVLCGLITLLRFIYILTVQLDTVFIYVLVLVFIFILALYHTYELLQFPKADCVNSCRCTQPYAHAIKIYTECVE